MQRLTCSFAVVIGIALCFSCASTPPEVRVEGAAADLSKLAGRWDGEYTSEATGRSGSIEFDLVAGEEHAHGDVVMIPRGSTSPYRPAPRVDERNPVPAAQELKIRFVKAEGAKVSGTLEPYWDPDCNCEVTTTFEGEVRGDTIRGTFASVHTAARVFGTWKATRRASAR